MVCEKIFWTNPYLTELKTKVTSVSDNVVTLDETIFYAFSGGQESDSGTINDYKVLNAKRIDKEIYYTLDTNHNLKINEEVIVKIDWSRRYKLMKLHFAAEIILELICQNFNNPEKIGAHISEERARLDFIYEKNISKTFPLLEMKAKEIIENNLDITSDFLDEKNEKRFWGIKNFAKVSCGGTHIKRTEEIGKIILKRKNIGKCKERIEIYLES